MVMPAMLGPMVASQLPTATGITAAGGTTSIGSLLGGAGMFAGGISGLFGGNSETGKVRGKYIRKAIKNHWEETMKQADKYGIHRLVAMGMQPMSGQYGSFSDADKPDFSRMGQGLEKMFAGKSDLDMALAEMYRANADLARVRARKELLPGQSDTPIAPQVSPDGVIKNQKAWVPIKPEKAVQETFGVEGGRSGFMQIINRPDGGKLIRPTRDLQESTSEGVHAWEYAADYAYKVIRGISFSQLKTKGGMEDRNILRKLKRHLDKGLTGNSGHVYNPYKRAWYVQQGAKNKLFSHTNEFGASDEYYGVPNQRLKGSHIPNMRLKKSHRTRNYERSKFMYPE